MENEELPVSKREAHKKFTREKLLTAARSCFEQRGVLFTIEEVSKSAEVSIGCVYLYFKSKDEILAVLLSQDIAAGSPPIQAICRYLAPELAEVLHA